MIKERAWPVRVMYILIAAALAMGLFVMAAPTRNVSAADEVKAEWERVSTPTTDGWVLAPESSIIDYALASAGEVAYAVVYSDVDMDGDGYDEEYRLLKSDDGAATWDDITDALEDAVEDGAYIDRVLHVATDWVNPNFVAVALDVDMSSIHVFISDDGGQTFVDAGEVEDDGVEFGYPHVNAVSDLAVSPVDTDGERDIAIGGRDNYDDAALFRTTAKGDEADPWEDATEYGGWDDEDDGSPFTSEHVTDIIFSPNWDEDNTILVTTVDIYDGLWDSPFEYGAIYLQCGSWGASPGWNEKSTLGISSVLIVEDEWFPMLLAEFDARGIAGMTLPENYHGRFTDRRVLWVWVNYQPAGPDLRSEIFRVENDDRDPLGSLGQIEDGEVWIANIAYKGTIASGEALAGLIGATDGPFAYCCEGVQIYYNGPNIQNMFICCEPWAKACDGKLPTGRAAMAVSYVGPDKAYAVALRGEPGDEYYDESAWSVSFDDGYIWNQLSLVDTYIHYFSDVEVSPDCNKMMLVSVNDERGCECDSVWLYADEIPEAGYDEYSGKWLRTWCGSLEGDYWEGGWEAGMLRLAPEELEGEEVQTVYLFDYGTGNVYWNDQETLACWNPVATAELEEIVDLALQDADTLFALDSDGDVAMFDEGDWHDAVDSEVEDGAWSIAVLGDNILVGGRDGQVSYSDDGGETFTELEDIAFGTGNCKVTVAFDTYFGQNGNEAIYAAVEAWSGNCSGIDPNNPCGKFGGIYRWAVNESESWTDLKAEPYESQIGVDDGDAVDEPVEVAFTGIVLDRPGNPYTDADNGGVIYASYYGVVHSNNNTVETWFTGAARSLERQVTVCTTCLDWDFLHVGLTIDEEIFEATPDALKICGCLSPTTNSKLYAIDAWDDYDYFENEYGSVWTFEDCYGKKAPDTTTPVVKADPCSCFSAPFTLTWDTLCDACVYEIEFALDADFTMPVYVNSLDVTTIEVTGDTPGYSVMGGEAGGLSCETTYYWRVRASEAATGQVIHSWWTVGESFTVPPSVEAGVITLVAPVPGALDQPTKNVGFSWNLLAQADSFAWRLSKSADLSNPIDSKTVSGKACTYTGTLDYGTTYYWQVTASKNNAVIGTSSVGTFTTAAQGPFCCPQDGLCFATAPELQAHNTAQHPAQPATPIWVWVVIAIGAVLVIVVIVLIFRTRRV